MPVFMITLVICRLIKWKKAPEGTYERYVEKNKFLSAVKVATISILSEFAFFVAIICLFVAAIADM